MLNANRTWNDANGDYVPQEAELGPLSNSSFGQTVVTTRWAQDLLDKERTIGLKPGGFMKHPRARLTMTAPKTRK